jgi:hypothetical protein
MFPRSSVKPTRLSFPCFAFRGGNVTTTEKRPVEILPQGDKDKTPAVEMLPQGDEIRRVGRAVIRTTKLGGLQWGTSVGY